MAWLEQHRFALGVVAIVLVILGGTGYVGVTAWQQQVGATDPPSAASGEGLLVIDVTDGQNRVMRVSADGTKTSTGLRCQRVYADGGTIVCLRLSSPGPTFEAAVFDGAGTLIREVALPGIPSRARVSASGRVISWTVFVTGDSYAVPGQFSTRTGVLELTRGSLVESLENFLAVINGVPYQAADINYWGLTVAHDDRTFYATLGSMGRTWLMRGDLTTRSLRSVRENAECPSLSPDGTKVAYKKRTGRLGAWQLAVLDLATGIETLLPGTEGLDDQAAWLDVRTLLYARASGVGDPPAVYRVSSDGSAPPSVLVRGAVSPVPPT